MRKPRTTTAMPPRRAITPELIRAALAMIPSDLDRETWARVGMAVKASDLDADTAFALWDDWSARGTSYRKHDARDTWRSLKASGRTTVGTLFGIAKDHGFKFPKADAPVQTPAPDAAAQAEAERLADERRRRREAEAAEYKRRADRAAVDARTLWDDAGESGPDGYLERKGVRGHGVRHLADGTLLVPMRDADGLLQNVQRIAPAPPAEGGPEKRFLPGGRKSGLWHLIGAIEAAPVLLLAEGYATAASLHEATGWPVAVAFDAGNLVHVAKALRQQHPTLPLLVCGDDDRETEQRTGRNPGRDKAASAARAAATDGAVAGTVFPEGLPAGGTDFNDLAAHAGAAAVREQVARAAEAPGIPKPRRTGQAAPGEAIGAADERTPVDVDEAAPAARDSRRSSGAGRRGPGGAGRRGGGDDDGDDNGPSEADPFVLVTPDEQVSARDSRCDRPGVWFLPKDSEGNAKRPQWLCAPLYVTALTRTDDGNGWGLLLEFSDPDRRHKTWAMPSALLSGEGAEWAGRLRDMGLRIAPGTAARNRLAQYLDTRNIAERVTCTSRVGWHGGVYVQPSRCIGEGDEGTRYVFQSEAGIEDTFRQRGTLDEWRDGVAALCAGNSRLVFAVCCAFGGPLMGPMALQTGGFHLVGESSLGKTTALLVAASVWGSPAFKQQWRTTDNALESTASQHSDCLLILDEISQAEGRIVGECAYMLGNEQEKGRSTRTNLLRKRRTWRLLFLSSGEKGLGDHMQEAGKKVNEGQLLRMPSVPADAGAGLGMLEQLHGFDDGKAFVSAITRAAASTFGAVGDAWLSWLAEHLTEVEARAGAIMARFEAECVPERAHPQVQRVAARFALVAAAGELATKAGLTGWEVGESVRSGRQCFEAWLAKRGHTGNGERYAMALQVKAFLEKNGDALFTVMHRANDDHRPNTPLRLGFRRLVDEQGEPIKFDGAQDYVDRRAPDDGRSVAHGRWQFLCLTEAFRRDICKGFDPHQVAGLLRDRGHLMTEDDRLTVRQRIPGMEAKVSVYLIKPSLFADEFEDL